MAHETFIQRVHDYSKAHRLFDAPGKVVVAVSGGVDSLALLYVLMALRDDFGIHLHVATFDHGLRGEAGADDVRFVGQMARAADVPFSAGREDVPARAREWKMGIEAAARRARYTFLASVAQEIGAHVIATGHSRDDQAETVLMHVIRGSGLAGLRGMQPRTPLRELNILPACPPGLLLIRPLLESPRAEIESYVRSLGLSAREDATNADTGYTRNRVRHEVLPLLEAINPGVRSALARLAEIARGDYEALLATLPPLRVDGGIIRIAQDEFLRLRPAQQRLLIRRAAGIELSFEQTEQALRLATTEHARGVGLRLAPGLTMRMASGEIAIFRDDLFPPGCPWLPVGASVRLTGAGEYTLPGSGWVLRLSPPPLSSSPDDGEKGLAGAIALPPEAELILRTPRRGDRFRPRGMDGHSQKLSDTLINMKVRAEWRKRLVLLTVNGEIVWFAAPVGDNVRVREAHLHQGGEMRYFVLRPPPGEL